MLCFETVLLCIDYVRIVTMVQIQSGTTNNVERVVDCLLERDDSSSNDMTQL